MACGHLSHQNALLLARPPEPKLSQPFALHRPQDHPPALQHTQELVRGRPAQPNALAVLPRPGTEQRTRRGEDTELRWSASHIDLPTALHAAAALAHVVSTRQKGQRASVGRSCRQEGWQRGLEPAPAHLIGAMVREDMLLAPVPQPHPLGRLGGERAVVVRPHVGFGANALHTRWCEQTFVLAHPTDCGENKTRNTWTPLF
eukprot:scaffold18245_cov191-Isochrysis_galbana.AAC.2